MGLTDFVFSHVALEPVQPGARYEAPMNAIRSQVSCKANKGAFGELTIFPP